MEIQPETTCANLNDMVLTTGPETISNIQGNLGAEMLQIQSVIWIYNSTERFLPLRASRQAPQSQPLF